MSKGRMRTFKAYGVEISTGQIAEMLGKKPKTVYTMLNSDSYNWDVEKYLARNGIEDSFELMNRLSAKKSVNADVDDVNADIDDAVNEIMNIIEDGARVEESDEDKAVVREVMRGDVPKAKTDRREEEERPMISMQTAERVQRLRAYNAMIDKLGDFVTMYEGDLPSECVDKLDEARETLERYRMDTYRANIDWEYVARGTLEGDGGGYKPPLQGGYALV